MACPRSIAAQSVAICVRWTSLFLISYRKPKKSIKTAALAEHRAEHGEPRAARAQGTSESRQVPRDREPGRLTVRRVRVMRRAACSGRSELTRRILKVKAYARRAALAARGCRSAGPIAAAGISIGRTYRTVLLSTRPDRTVSLSVSRRPRRRPARKRSSGRPPAARPRGQSRRPRRSRAVRLKSGSGGFFRGGRGELGGFLRTTI